MAPNFSFDNEQYNFWSIYEAIKVYYPLGIDNEYPGIFFDYWGIKQLEQIVIEKVHDDKNYSNEWKNYWDEVSNEIQLPIIGTTYGQEPSFSSYIQLKNEKTESCDYTEELHFAVSFVGPFYTIIGQSTTVVKHKEEEYHNYAAVNRITVSPDRESQKYFDLLAGKIESKYKGYKFVPYCINEQVVEGLRVRYRDDKVNRIYHALFNDNVHLPDTGKYDPLVQGDEYYRFEDWKR